MKSLVKTTVLSAALLLAVGNLQAASAADVDANAGVNTTSTETAAKADVKEHKTKAHKKAHKAHKKEKAAETK